MLPPRQQLVRFRLVSAVGYVTAFAVRSDVDSDVLVGFRDPESETWDLIQHEQDDEGDDAGVGECRDYCDYVGDEVSGVTVHQTASAIG